MLTIDLSLAIMLMTIYAGKARVRSGIGVALTARTPLSPMFPRVDPEILRVMIERRGLPHRCRVTQLTLVTEVCHNVVRIRGYCELRRMALITIGIHKLIIAANMA